MQTGVELAADTGGVHSAIAKKTNTIYKNHLAVPESASAQNVHLRTRARSNFRANVKCANKKCKSP